jgi:sugar phosphate permease
MIGLVFFALAISYIDRANLAVAAPTMRAELGIDATSMGLILSGFFWTYALMQLPFGWFADRVGPRVAFSIAVVWWSIFTAATALARGFGSLMGYRLLLGVGEAGANPSSVKVISAWFSVRERGFAASIFDSGVRIGPVITLPLVAWLINSFGWQTSFVATSLLGLVWVVVWLWLYREPEQHPSVTPEQLKILQSERGRPTSTEEDHAKLSWIGLFRYRTIWAMMIGFFCLNFAFYFFITWFPTYLVQARGFSLAQLGTLGMLPVLVASPGSWLGGLTSDFLYRRGWSLTAARKTCLVGAMLMSSVITLAVISTNVYVMLACFSISYASLGFAGANVWSLPSDVAPTAAHVASIGGIQNFASNLAGILVSTFTGVMLTITEGSFVVPLATAGGLCIVGAAVYLFMLGRIEPLPLPEAPMSAQRMRHA